MKPLTLTDVLESLDDKPASIGTRLEGLGLTAEELAGVFSKDILETSVYASSFIKFLNDNKDKLSFEQDIPAAELPADFKNAFEDEGMTIGDRLAAMDVDTGSTFSQEILGLSVNGEEFQDFLLKNQDKFFALMENLPAGGTSGN